MVLLDQQRRVEIGGWFPGIVIRRVTFPADKVLALGNRATVIKDLFDFIGRSHIWQRDDLQLVR